MVIFIIITIIILFVIVVVNSSSANTTYKSKNERILEDLNNYKKSRNYRPSDELYASVTKQHSDKSLSQIREYLESHRKDNDPYWEHHKMEYKILVERQSLLFSEEIKNVSNLLSDDISTMTYVELLDYYNKIRYNTHIYRNVNLSRICDTLEELSYQKYSPVLKEKTPSTVVRWLEARQNEGEYISKRLKIMAKEMEAQESEDVVYKRKLKNLQNRLSKANKDSIRSKVAEIQDELDNFKRKKN